MNLKAKIIEWIDELPKGSRISFGIMYLVIMGLSASNVVLWRGYVSLAASFDSINHFHAKEMRLNDEKWFARLEECEKRSYRDMKERQAAVIPPPVEVKKKEDEEEQEQ